MVIQILMGLKAMHEADVIHRDIKCENIFMKRDGRVKIGDFGLSKVMEAASAHSYCGTQLYMAPEV